MSTGTKVVVGLVIAAVVGGWIYNENKVPSEQAVQLEKAKGDAKVAAVQAGTDLMKTAAEAAKAKITEAGKPKVAEQAKPVDAATQKAVDDLNNLPATGAGNVVVGSAPLAPVQRGSNSAGSGAAAAH